MPLGGAEIHGTNETVEPYGERAGRFVVIGLGGGANLIPDYGAVIWTAGVLLWSSYVLPKIAQVEIE